MKFIILLAFALSVFSANEAARPLMLKINRSGSGQPAIFHSNVLYMSKESQNAVVVQCSFPENMVDPPKGVMFEWSPVGNMTSSQAFNDQGNGNIQIINKPNTQEDYQCVVKDTDKKPLENWLPTILRVVRKYDSIVITASGNTTLNYHPKDTKVLENSAFNITCDCTTGKTCVTKSRAFRFEFNGKALPNDKHIKLDYEAGTLVVEKPSYLSAGVYSCISEVDSNQVAFIEIRGPKTFGVKHGSRSTSENKMEGDSVSIKVDIHGYPTNQTITWVRRVGDDESDENETINQEFMDKHPELAKRIRFYPTTETVNGELEIINLVKADRAYYIAVMTNEEPEEKAMFVTLIRVKGKLDALWPFLGIVAEVIILVAIIFIYERRRSKQEADVEETPEQKALTAKNTNNENVRQRTTK